MIKRKFYEITNRLTDDRIIKIQKDDNCIGIEVNGIVLTRDEIKIIDMVYADTIKEAKTMNELLSRFNLYSYQWSDCNCYTRLKYKIESIEEYRLKHNRQKFKQLTLI